MYRITIFFFLITIYSDCYTQSLIGLWNGFGHSHFAALKTTSESLEIISQKENTIAGIAHYYYSDNRFEHIKFHGFINWNDSSINIIEDKEISLNLDTSKAKTCFGTISLKISKSGNLWSLDGKWRDKNRKLFNCPTFKVKYEMAIVDSIHTNSGILNGDKSERYIDVQKVIELIGDETDSIRLSIYDNGEIDNDTASLYLNDSVIIKSKRLTQIPVQVLIKLDKKKLIHKIRLVAENLGSIPPNTALLVITTRLNKYVINLSSDFSKNGSVEFFLKE
jgi:hypothetical protein